jgi:hypothetical protein
VLTNRVEKDSTLTEVVAAYIVPVEIEVPLSVEKYSFVALIEPVNMDKVESDVPINVEKFSLIVLREDVTVAFARIVSCENIDDVKKFTNIEDVYASKTVMVHPNILETEMVLFVIDDTNRDDTIIF